MNARMFILFMANNSTFDITPFEIFPIIRGLNTIITRVNGYTYVGAAPMGSIPYICDNKSSNHSKFRSHGSANTRIFMFL